MEAAIQNIKLNLIKVNQNSNVFYIGKIKASDLLSIATLHWRNSGNSEENKYVNEVKKKLNVYESSDGIQRVIQQKRLKEIAHYLDSKNSILPNSIIVALNNKWDEEEAREEDGFVLDEDKEENDFITLDIIPNKVDAFIVDGQHRLASFGYTEKTLPSDFELVVSIFLNLEVPIQAELFSIINSKQKPVNKSLLYDLSSFKEYDDIKRCHSIVKWLDNHEISPFFNKIKMLGTGVGSISQSAFIDELIRYTKERKIKKFKSFMRDFQDKEIIRIILSYFSALKEHFGIEAWEDTKKYVFLKTTGFGALMKLLYYVYVKHTVYNKPFNKLEIQKTIEVLDSKDFLVDSIGKGGSQGLQTQLFYKLRDAIFEDEILRNKYDFEIEYKFEKLINKE